MKAAIWIIAWGILSLGSTTASAQNFDAVAGQLLSQSEMKENYPPFSRFRDHFEHISNFNLARGHKIADHAVVMKIDDLDLVIVIEAKGNSFLIHVLANSAVGVPGWRLDSRGLFSKFKIIESRMWEKFGEEAAFFNMFKAYLNTSEDLRRRLPQGPLFRQVGSGQFVVYEGFTHQLHSRKNHPLRKEVLIEFLKMLAEPISCEMMMASDKQSSTLL